MLLLFMSVLTILTAQASPIAEGNNELAFDLYKLNAKQKGNLFFSPLSISTALSMTSAGARGETLAQINKTLHLPANPHSQYKSLLQQLISKEEYKLSIANQLWARDDKKYESEFKSTLLKNYSAHLQALNFAKEPKKAADTINAWVYTMTNGLIPDIVSEDSFGSATEMIITNAIYFKGQWETAFDKKDTRQEAFWIEAKNKVKTSLMHQTAELRYAENNEIQMVSLPYKGNDLEMLVVLPKTKNGLKAVESKLDYKKFKSWLDSLNSTEVILALPSFKTESSLSLSDQMEKLGMPLAFNKKKADFTGIRKLNSYLDERIYINSIRHKAFVEVNEEGTEAAAVTAVETLGAEESVEPEPVVFTANHPFLYFIRHYQSGAILFMGRYSKPN